MERPENLTTAELRAELATYGVHVSYVTKKWDIFAPYFRTISTFRKRPALEEQLTYLRASGPPTNVERDSDETQVQSDLESIVKMMKENSSFHVPINISHIHLFRSRASQSSNRSTGDVLGLARAGKRGYLYYAKSGD